VALSEASEELRTLFNYRYPKGTKWEGHSFGNLFLSTVEMTTNDFGEAVKLASKVLNIRGKVVPMTLMNCKLAMAVRGKTIIGQYAIEKTIFNARQHPPHMWLEPDSLINPEARQALARADLIVIAPGNLYASLMPALLVNGVREALAAASAPVVYVCNLVNKPNHTTDFAVHDYVAELERFIGSEVVGAVFYNTDQPTRQQLDQYALDGEFPVVVDESVLRQARYQAIGGRFLAQEGAVRDDNDTFIYRSLIRHDAEAIARQLMEFVSGADASS